MITYRFRVVTMDVHKWTEEGEGEYVCTKGSYEVGGYRTPQELREGLECHFPGIEISPEEDAYLHYAQVEDAEGYRDDGGKYIVDYLIAVEKVQVEPFLLDAEREAAA